MSFKSKVVLVTGASSGIGAAIALKFAAEGAQVAIVGRNEKKLQDVSKKIEKTGSKPLVIVADVTKDSDSKRIVDSTIQKFQKLDVLINNAGIGGVAAITDEHTMEVLDKVMNTNFRSVVYLTHLASKHLIETKGNVINISSIAALKSFGRTNYAYCASKAALDHFTRSIASDFATKGVRANVINPGPVKTDIIENMGTPAAHEAAVWEQMKSATALKRISDPEEIGDLALFLASDKAVAITGASFVTDNGCLVNTNF